MYLCDFNYTITKPRLVDGAPKAQKKRAKNSENIEKDLAELIRYYISERQRQCQVIIGQITI